MKTNYIIIIYFSLFPCLIDYCVCVFCLERIKRNIIIIVTNQIVYLYFYFLTSYDYVRLESNMI